MLSFYHRSAQWQQRFTDECERLREQNAQLQTEFDEQTRSLNDRLDAAAVENSEHRRVRRKETSFPLFNMSYLLFVEMGTTSK